MSRPALVRLFNVQVHSSPVVTDSVRHDAGIVTRRVFAFCGGLFLVLLALYWWSLGSGSGITWTSGWSDSGELAAASASLGITHPPGYGLYTLLGHVVSRWTVLGPPGYALAILSGFYAALAATLLCWVVLCLYHRLDCHLVALPGTIADQRRKTLAQYGTALYCALVVGLSPALWLGTVVAETRTLLALCITIILACTVVQASKQPIGKLKQAATAYLVIGLAIAAHPLALLALPLIGVLIFRQLSARHAAGAGLMALFLGLPSLLTWTYLYVRAQQRPTLDWGSPNTPEGLFWLVTARQYHYLLGLGGWNVVLERLSERSGDLVALSGPIPLCLAMWGIVVLWNHYTDLAIGLLATVIADLLFIAWDGAEAASAYLVVPLMLIAMCSGIGMFRVLVWLPGKITTWSSSCLIQRVGHVQRRGQFQEIVWLPGTTISWAVLLFLCLLVQLPQVSTSLARINAMKSTEALPILFARHTLDTLPRHSVLIAPGDQLPFALWYAQQGLHDRSDVRVIDRDLLVWPWYRQEQNNALHSDRWRVIAIPAKTLYSQQSEQTENDRWIRAILAHNPRRSVFMIQPDSLDAGLCHPPLPPIDGMWICQQ